MHRGDHREPIPADEEHVGRTLFLTTLAAVLFVGTQLAVVPRGIARPAPSKGHSKILISHLLALPDASAPPPLAYEDVTVLEDYDSYTLGFIAAENVEKIKKRAAADRVGVEVHDEYDLVGLPGGTIDTRVGVVPPLGVDLPSGYPAGTYGLYVLQLIGPPKRQWLSQITAAGAVIVGPVPLNGYLVAMTPQTASSVRTLRPVQFLDLYHSFLKAAMVDRQATGKQDVLVEIAEVPDAAETIEKVTGILGEVTQRKDHGGFYLRGKMYATDLPLLLADRLVIGVHAITPLRLSDERQSMALTTNVMTSGSNLIPTNPGGYAAWLNSACSFCGNLNNEQFIVGIADTGVDTGALAHPSRHLDLQPTGRVRYGNVFLTQRDGQDICAPGEVCEDTGVCFDCDGNYHGSFVAGVVAGNAGTTKRDRTAPTTGFLLGTGVAPSAGILSTKIYSASGGQPTTFNGNDNNVFIWAADATSRNVYIQNHSNNQYAFAARGNYTQQSQEFDRAVRDSNGTGMELTPITLTVSAGNRHQDFGNPLLVPPATAKNVIAVGGAESVRDSSEWRQSFGCESGVIQTQADSFANIMADSKYGTNVQSGGQGWNTYNKPDLFAPASQIVGVRSVVIRNQFPYPGYNCFGYGGDPPADDHDYMIVTGTSFAAPVGAAGALLAGRAYSHWLGDEIPDPAAASPALRKAILVASARSMRGGLDEPADPVSPPSIEARPNAVQGFGRISLVDLVSQTPARQYVDQSPARTFTQSSQKWSATYPVSDPTKPVKIVLAWTDAPAEPGTGAVFTLLQNNLDLDVRLGHSTSCTSYAGNNLTTSTEIPTEGEQSIPYSCAAGNPDTKNNVETVIFFPDAVDVDQFTVVVNAKLIGASAIPDTNCQGSDCNEQDFALFIYNAGAPITLGTPAGVEATATSTTSVLVTWSPVTGAASYRISRRTNGGEEVVGTTTANSFPDTTASANTAYLYRVQALDPANNAGGYSSSALATTVMFTDDPLATQMTIVKAMHVDQLREAVNAVRSTALLPAATFTDSSLAGIPVKAVHIQELRTNLDAARSNLGFSGLTYTDSPLTAGTLIKTVHLTQIRDGLK
jgi:hypothetical protein